MAIDFPALLNCLKLAKKENSDENSEDIRRGAGREEHRCLLFATYKAK